MARLVFAPSRSLGAMFAACLVTMAVAAAFLGLRIGARRGVVRGADART